MTEPMTLTAEHADFLRKIMPFFQALKAHFDDRTMLSALSDGAACLGTIADAIDAVIKARDAAVPVSVPDGWVLVPRTLTAENGAKVALMGEFEIVCPSMCEKCVGCNE